MKVLWKCVATLVYFVTGMVVKSPRMERAGSSSFRTERLGVNGISEGRARGGETPESVGGNGANKGEEGCCLGTVGNLERK